MFVMVNIKEKSHLATIVLAIVPNIFIYSLISEDNICYTGKKYGLFTKIK
jgi:hypothetical protein